MSVCTTALKTSFRPVFQSVRKYSIKIRAAKLSSSSQAFDYRSQMLYLQTAAEHQSQLAEGSEAIQSEAEERTPEFAAEEGEHNMSEEYIASVREHLFKTGF